MPADAPITVRNSFGSVDIAGIHGAADVENGYGTLTVRDAGAGRWNNSFGGVEVSAPAGNVTLSDNNGSVHVSDVKGTLQRRNRFGSVTAPTLHTAVTITGANA